MERAKLAKSFSKNLTSTIRKAVVQNKTLILREVRKKRDLYQLLVKWNRGQELTSREKDTIRNQLIDIAKTIPALAIFVLPFGSLVLLMMMKYLPGFLLPNLFHEIAGISEKSFTAQKTAAV